MQRVFDSILVLWEFFKAYPVPILTVSCVPLVGGLLWLLRDKLDLTLRQIIGLAVSFVVFGLLSLIVFGMLHDGRLYPSSTYQHQGLIFFMPLWFYAVSKWLKRDWREVFDVFSVILPFVVAGIRTYCISQGCCYGLPFFGSATVQWPVREITMALNIIIGLVFYRWIRREHTPGIMLPTYLMLYSLIRFEEVVLWGNIYRDWSYKDRTLAILSFVIGICFYFRLDREKAAARPETERNRQGREEP